MGAALAIKELMQQGKLKGTIRFYGTPAEEAVGGKIYMARDGLFSDVDVCLDWHRIPRMLQYPKKLTGDGGFPGRV